MHPITRAAKGLLDPAGAARHIQLARYPPSAELMPFVEYFWLVRWDLGEKSHRQSTLPHPNAQLVFERGRTAVYGVITKSSHRTISGSGVALGVHFRIGGLRPFLDGPMSKLTDRVVSAAPFISADISETEAAVLGARDDQ